MNRKSPVRLEELAASMGRNVQKPQRLQANMGNAARMPRQVAPARASGLGAGGDSAGVQPGRPMPSPVSSPSSVQPGQPARQGASRQAPPHRPAASHPAPVPSQGTARPSRPAPVPSQGTARPSHPAPVPRQGTAQPGRSAVSVPRCKALAGTRLQKGQKVSLAENGRPLSQVEVSIGWNAKNPACDLDASAFLLSGSGKVVGDEWFVFYGQERSPDGSVVHHGDSTGGMGESLTVNWRVMDSRVKKIVFTITINEALRHGLNFSMVSNAYIQLRSPVSGQGILHFELDEYYNNVTSMMVGELYERNGEWKFHAIGNGVARDLAGLCGLYGVNVSG